MTQKHSILVVDDEKQNRTLLSELLKDDYKILLAKNGAQALERARKHLPDLIMLDVLMPEMDGHQVIRELKSDELTCDIPVIFISALDSACDEEKGLELGALDYISKPFHPPIVRARVRNHLSLCAALSQLRAQKQSLEEAAVLRDDVERIMHHDLKNPLNGILGAAQMMLSDSPTEDESIEWAKMIERSGYTMLDMISRSLDLYKMEQGLYRFEPQPVDLIPILKRVISDNGALVRMLHLGVALNVGDHEAGGSEVFLVPGDAPLCYSMLANLIKNAMEASNEQGSVAIGLRCGVSGSTVSIRNQGEIPEEIREHFFEKYATSGKFSGTGLGTYSARLMMQTMGGDIGFETSAESGTEVMVRFPLFSGDFAAMN
ncbi:MAG: hybrid sensor histidine kinase/response regulator [Sulfuricella sp.]|nr:hybrid sensor histidine kinase/response regulator [Sulfuricella sp.]